MRAEEYSRRELEVAGWPIAIETYRLGSVYHCTISSVASGARFARANGVTKDEAEYRALQKADYRLRQTRRRA
jgi:hypothetical protein